LTDPGVEEAPFGVFEIVAGNHTDIAPMAAPQFGAAQRARFKSS
jgi:hypothetical protein